MNKKISILEKYYVAQQKHHNTRDTNSEALYDDTLDAWRHQRMYSYIDPLITKAKLWLTVGDGRYGEEAHYIERLGGKALATDISTKRLKIAKKEGYISEYKKENAEKMSFKDETFDYVLCKESYHHFPRPMIALYEMIRVAKKAVVLIEPNDVIRRGFTYKQLLGIEEIKRKVNRFEVSGNYVYTTSRREFEKVALGIGLPTLAFAGFDDYYEKGMGKELFNEKGPKYKKFKLIIWILDIAYRLGIRDRSLLVTIIFKKKPTKNIVKALQQSGYTVNNLPKNPYLK